MRENEVRSQVSGARSAQNEPVWMSRAVRQTPLTETLSPGLSSLGARSAATVMRRFSPRCLSWVIRPTSSTMPVNTRASGNQYLNSPQGHRDTEKTRKEKNEFLYVSVTLW